MMKSAHETNSTRDAHDDTAGIDPDDEPAEQPGWSAAPGTPVGVLTDPRISLQVEVMMHVGTDSSRDIESNWPERDLASLVESIRSVAQDLGVATGRLTIALVDDAEMTRLHREFCGIDSTTDVLTFSLDDPKGVVSNADGADRPTTHVDADLAIGVDEAMRQSKERGHEPSREILLYVIHGLLHCLGYDDATDAEYDAMHRIEDELLTRIGLGPTFHRDIQTSASR